MERSVGDETLGGLAFRRGAECLRILVGLCVCAWPIVWAIDPYAAISQRVVLDQYTSLELGFALGFAFLSSSLRAESLFRQVSYAVGALAGLVVGIWLFFLFSRELIFVSSGSPIILTLCFSAMAVCLLASRESAGIETVIMIAGFLVFGYAAQFLPSWIGSPPIRFESYVSYMVFGSNGLLGQALQIIATTVLAFLLFGIAFELAGGTRAIGAVALIVARVGRGAAISVTIVASGLFGMISGSATSNVLAAGSFSIPGMKRMGVSPATAGGIEAVASTIGQVMPPVMGAAAFLMANATGIPYTHVALASLAPALLCYGALFLQGEALGRRLELENGPASFSDDQLSLGWGDLLHLLPIAGMIAVLVLMPYAPEVSAIVATGLALVVALVLKGPTRVWSELRSALPKASKSISNLVITASTVGIMLAVIASTGLDVKLTVLIGTLGQQNLFLSLILTSLAAFILGLGAGTSGVYIVTGTLLAPGLIALGVPQIAAHLFVLYSAMLSLITPPVAFASLTAAGIAGSEFYKTSNEAMKFGWTLFLVPFLIVYSPQLVLVGSPWEIAATITAAFAGVLLMGHAVHAGLGLPWHTPRAWLVLLAGLLMVLPVLPLPFRALAGVGGLTLTAIRLAASPRRFAPRRTSHRNKGSAAIEPSD